MSPIFRVKSELGLGNLLNTIWLHKNRSHFCHIFRHRKTWNDFVTDSRPRRSFLGLLSVLNPIGLDTKKPRNYLIVRGLSRIFRFSSEVHSGGRGDWTLVQTRTQQAFYMLSLRIVFRVRTGPRQPILTLVPLFRAAVGTPAALFPNFSAPPCPNVSEPGNGEMSRSPHFEANKGTLLYFRLRSESVIVIFANYRSTLLLL